MLSTSPPSSEKPLDLARGNLNHPVQLDSRARLTRFPILSFKVKIIEGRAFGIHIVHTPWTKLAIRIRFAHRDLSPRSSLTLIGVDQRPALCFCEICIVDMEFNPPAVLGSERCVARHPVLGQTGLLLSTFWRRRICTITYGFTCATGCGDCNEQYCRESQQHLIHLSTPRSDFALVWARLDALSAGSAMPG